MFAQACAQKRDLLLDLLNVVVAAFEVDLWGGWSDSVVVEANRQGQGKTYVFDSNEVTSGLLDSLVDDTETSAAQLLQHVIVVGHCGVSKSGMHCYVCCAASVLSSLGIAVDREKMRWTIEAEACMRVVCSGLLYRIVRPSSSERSVLVMSQL